jgi:hypothetical protein
LGKGGSVSELACGRHKRWHEGVALGRSCGWFGTKVHVRAEGEGKLLVFMLSGGERHEQTAFESLMEDSGFLERYTHHHIQLLEIFVHSHA